MINKSKSEKKYLQVTTGFTTAAALTIGSSQVKSLLGLKGSANGFMESWLNVFKNIEETKLWDSLLGACTIVLLLSLKKLNYKKSIHDDQNISVTWNETKKYLLLGRNALAVIVGTALVYLLNLYGLHPFTLTGKQSIQEIQSTNAVF